MEQLKHLIKNDIKVDYSISRSDLNLIEKNSFSVSPLPTQSRRIA